MSVPTKVRLEQLSIMHLVQIYQQQGKRFPSAELAARCGTPNNTSDDEVSTFEYDKLGQKKFADYGDGIWVKYDYTGAGGDWTTLEAPTIGKIERKLTADGKLAGWVTPDGGTPTFKYDQLRRLFRETVLLPVRESIMGSSENFDNNSASSGQKEPEISSVSDCASSSASLSNDPLTYNLLLEPSGISVDPITGSIKWTPTDANPPSDTVNP